MKRHGNNFKERLYVKIFEEQYDYGNELFISFMKKYTAEKLHKNHFEVDAQIYAMKQVKRHYKEEWNNITIADLFYRYAALRDIARVLYKRGENAYTSWLRELIQGMQREDILGDNMTDYPEYSILEDYETERLLRI